MGWDFGDVTCPRCAERYKGFNAQGWLRDHVAGCQRAAKPAESEPPRRLHQPPGTLFDRIFLKKLKISQWGSD